MDPPNDIGNYLGPCSTKVTPKGSYAPRAASKPCYNLVLPLAITWSFPKRSFPRYRLRCIMILVMGNPHIRGNPNPDTRLCISSFHLLSIFFSMLSSIRGRTSAGTYAPVGERSASSSITDVSPFPQIPLDLQPRNPPEVDRTRNSPKPE